MCGNSTAYSISDYVHTLGFQSSCEIKKWNLWIKHKKKLIIKI